MAFGAAPMLAQVYGGTFYTSFGANAGSVFPPAAFSTNNWCISGAASLACGPAQFREVAAPFRPAATGGFEGISLALASGSGTNGVIVSLALDSGGTPGNVLESWTVTNLPNGTPPPLTTVADRLNLTLTSGQLYWVSVQSMASDTYVTWYTNILGFGGAMANNGSGWQLLTGIFATQPAFSVNMSRAGALAHIAAGGGWTTVISLANPSATQIQVLVNLFADDGSPLNLAATTVIGGVTQTGAASNQVQTALNPNSTFLITVGGVAGNTAVGWAEVYSTGPVTGYAIFRQTPQSGPPSEGTVPLQSQAPYTIALPYDNTAGFVMGVALANLSPIPQNITVAINDGNGNLIGSQSISIAANGHSSFVLPNEFPVTAGKLGTMQFTGNGSLSGLGLRFSPFGTFTSVPTTIVAPASQ